MAGIFYYLYDYFLDARDDAYKLVAQMVDGYLNVSMASR